MFANDVA
jgi:hypothetical protein